MILFIEDGNIKHFEDAGKNVEIISEANVKVFENAFLFPAFKDCHGHIESLGRAMNGLWLGELKSPEECIQKILEYKGRRGEWVYGTGWNQELWSNKDFPNAEMLDEAFPKIPVYLARIDYHAAWINSKALEIAGISRSTVNPPGGEIVKDKSGKPTGIILDNALNMIAGFIPDYSQEQYRRFIISAVNELAAYGFTEVHDMDLKPRYLEIFKELDNEDLLPVDIYFYMNPQGADFNYSFLDFKGRRLHPCGMKLYADGALGSRGAALFEPYSDMQGNYGLLTISSRELFNYSATALEKGLHVAVHAIGDRANSLVLSSFKKLFEEGIADSSSVLRLEHAQIIQPLDLEIFTKHEIIASVQPVHCTSDAAMARKRLGMRCEYAYPWKSLLNAGAILAAGSDFPIESHNPFKGSDAFIRRIPPGEDESWHYEQALSRQEALAAYSYPAARLFARGKNHFSLNIGDKADFIILDNDIVNCVEDTIVNTKVLAVVKDGCFIISFPK